MDNLLDRENRVCGHSLFFFSIEKKKAPVKGANIGAFRFWSVYILSHHIGD